MQAGAAGGAFTATGEAYDLFMGRYSGPLAGQFAGFAGAAPGQRALDIGCGPGALTSELVRLLGAGAVAACDPSERFVAVCRERNPGVEVRPGAAEAIPFEAATFDLALSQLVLFFVADAGAAAAEAVRVLRPGGTVAACVWQGMEMLAAFAEVATGLDPAAPADLRAMRLGREGELAQWLEQAGCGEVVEATLVAPSTYRDFDELWAGFLTGVGPAAGYLVRQSPQRQQALHDALHERLGSPTGAFTLGATARAGRGVRP